MRGISFFRSRLGVDLEEFLQLPRDRAAAMLRESIPDLLHFLTPDAASPEEREPTESINLAASLEARIIEALQPSTREKESLSNRIIIDSFLRSELDRDQNVYLGPFFTNVLTRATPDLVFQPQNHQELEVALQWARSNRVGLATRGAGSTAMGGAVPNNGGLLLEMSRFDQVLVASNGGVAIIGAGARFKQIHEKLAEENLALETYPSNLGGTLAGWFSAGGLGLNSFKYGPVQNQVRALSVLLPRGEHVRFHDDGRLDVMGPEEKPHRLTPEEANEWLTSHHYPEWRLHDLAQTEGQYGILLTFTVNVMPLPRLRPFYFEFDDEPEALHFAHWVSETATACRCPPANLKYLSRAHVAGVRAVRADASRTAKPAVYIDFDDAEEAERFESGLDVGKWKVHRDDEEARRWFADRFRPQQTKRLGPGFIAAEIVMPSRHLEPFLRRAVELAAGIGIHLESEVYFFGDGRALALPGYLTRGPRAGFLFEIVFAPILVDLAMSRYDGEPYVLGRWQAPFLGAKYKSGRARELRRAKDKTDPDGVLNPGVFLSPSFRIPGVAGIFRTTFPGGIRLMRWLYRMPLFAAFLRALLGKAVATDSHRERLNSAQAMAADQDAIAVAEQLEGLAHQARGCVNCGECNSVCPIFNDAKIRLPQMLTHIGEQLRANTTLDGTQQLLLDLCMRCGNCEEVCQADIPHVNLFAEMEKRAGEYAEERRERHATILAYLRHSEKYLHDFLRVRPGWYLNRTPASLPGEIRYLLFRSENDAGAEESCIHCGACVPVCPTEANSQYEDEADLRLITTDLSRCVGCGTCVEVCPANLKNDGQTLRVMEAPTRRFFQVLKEFEASSTGGEG